MYWWSKYLMLSNSDDDSSSFLVQEELSSLFARVWSFCPSFLWPGLTFSCRFTWELSTSKFEPEVPQFPEGKPTLILLSSFPVLTRDPDLRGETSSLHWPCMTRLVGGSGFCHRRSITRGSVLSRHGTNHKALSGLRENFWNGCQKMSGNSWC